MLVEAKIKDLQEDYIMLVVTIFLQNLIYLGYLLFSESSQPWRFLAVLITSLRSSRVSSME
jgi:hypothetical protein